MTMDLALKERIFHFINNNNSLKQQNEHVNCIIRNITAYNPLLRKTNFSCIIGWKWWVSSKKENITNFSHISGWKWWVCSHNMQLTLWHNFFFLSSKRQNLTWGSTNVFQHLSFQSLMIKCHLDSHHYNLSSPFFFLQLDKLMNIKEYNLISSSYKMLRWKTIVCTTWCFNKKKCNHILYSIT